MASLKLAIVASVRLLEYKILVLQGGGERRAKQSVLTRRPRSHAALRYDDSVG